MIIKRRRFKQSSTLEERLAEEAKELRKAAKMLPPSLTREKMLRKAREDKIFAHINEWLSSAGLKPPV